MASLSLNSAYVLGRLTFLALIKESRLNFESAYF